MPDPTVTTYSMWSLFRNCRKACEWRYVKELVPRERNENLSFGSLIHDCLRLWHEKRDLDLVLVHIDRACPNRGQDEQQKQDWHLARAMMKGYAARYRIEDFEPVFLEKCFEGRIRNPETGECSPEFVLAGKVDGIVRIGDEHFLLEHKTTSQLTGGYLERLWTDFQISVYSWYVEEALGIRVAGVIYNILAKAKLKQTEGETPEEFARRRSDLLARSKTGRTTATRKLPESDDAFAARLEAKYADPAMFHRERLYLSRDQMIQVQAELWELSRAFADARSRGVFYPNTGFCFHYNRPCSYFPLCRSCGNPHLIESLYERRPPHEELREEVTNETEKPF